MSTRTDWGWFEKDGTPIAVAHDHYKWKCEQGTWTETPMRENYITGELFRFSDDEPYTWQPACRMESTDIKVEECRVCGRRFVYP